MIASLAALLLIAAEPERPRYANLEVVTAVEGDAGSVLARRVRERAAVVLRGAAVLPARTESDPTILVSVQPSGGEEPGYAYRIELERGEEAIATPVEGRCDLCTEGELVATIVGAVLLGVDARQRRRTAMRFTGFAMAWDLPR